MNQKLNIVIIGAGNVAFHLGMVLQQQKHARVIQLFNHKVSPQTKLLSQKLNCPVVSDYKKINPAADVYIVAVKDDVIAEVVGNLKGLKIGGMVVHTSGSVKMKALKDASKNTGVLYPLQTFYPAAKIDWPSTPLLIESNTKGGLATLKFLTKPISKQVKVIGSADRLRFHLAAVFACNFTNAMYVSAYDLIEGSLDKKDTALLFPIMEQSFRKLETVHPLLAQTGPAMRDDKGVMKKHLELLNQDRDLQRLYKTISKLIVKQQSHK